MTKLTFQLYSARDYPPLGAVLNRLAVWGYSQVEGYDAIYKDMAGLTKALAASGLQMPTGHFDIAALEADVQHCLDVARTLGMTLIICPMLSPNLRPIDVAGWQLFGARLQEIATHVNAAGLPFAWHNHDYEFVILEDGSHPIDHIFAAAPNLNWEIDVAWITRAGLDPVVFIEKYADRIKAAHIKDLAPEGENLDEDRWADFGHGIVDWARILPALAATGAQNLVVEHDKPSDLDRFASRSIASARRLGVAQ